MASVDGSVEVTFVLADPRCRCWNRARSHDLDCHSLDAVLSRLRDSVRGAGLRWWVDGSPEAGTVIPGMAQEER